MKFSTAVVTLLAATRLAAGVSSASEPAEKTIEPTLASILAVAATATPVVYTSDVKGLAFDRFFNVWLENTDFSAAAGNADQQFLASQGITLTNFFATTHPSEPNYCAAAGGDNFGMDNDDFHSIPANVSTVVDLLDTKGISWAEYQEAEPYPGFVGYNYSNQKTFANDYVRKHNPLVLYQSITDNMTRMGLIKNFSEFESDRKAMKLPQWAFLTPNMTNDGHDTNITFASKWERSQIASLMNDSYFMNNTLVLLTFDEVETYTNQNKMFSILLGGAIPDELKGTTDDTFYNHYSTISTVSMNWGLPSLGRWDCMANVFEIVANKTKYANSKVNTTNLFFNSSYPGPLSAKKYVPVWPVPNTTAKCASGMGVLSSIVKTWGSQKETFNYTNVYPYDALTDNNVGGSATVETTHSSTSTTSSTAKASSSGAASVNTVSGGGVVAAILGLLALVA